MNFRNGSKQPISRWSYAGLIILFVAVFLWNLIGRQGPGKSSDFSDAMLGMVFGVAIGCMFVGVRKMYRSAPCAPRPEHHSSDADPRRG